MGLVSAPCSFDRVQEQNLTRQYGLLTNSIEIGLTKGSGAFDKFLLWTLNHAAVANISQFGGRFRLCVRSGVLLPGRKILPERITENREGYYMALRRADRAWEDGHLDFTAMEAYLAPLVQAQLENQD